MVRVKESKSKPQMPKGPKPVKGRAKTKELLKPKQHKHRVTRILKKMDPQLVENTKKILIFKGLNTSNVVTNAMKDFAMLSKPNCKVLNRKNEIVPFEDGTSMEFLSTKNDCSLTLMGSHSKKRPDNLVLVCINMDVNIYI